MSNPSQCNPCNSSTIICPPPVWCPCPPVSGQSGYYSDQGNPGYYNPCHKKCRKPRNCNYNSCIKVKCYPCIKVKCGYATASFTSVASPTFYTAAGTVITYTYTITNTGNVPLCGPIQLTDTIRGNQYTAINICPGASQVFSHTYTTTTADLQVPSITNTASVLIKFSCNKWLCPPPVTVVVTHLLD